MFGPTLRSLRQAFAAPRALRRDMSYVTGPKVLSDKSIAVPYQAKSAEDAVSAIKSKDKVYIHAVAAAPQQLIKAMVGRSSSLRDVELYHIHTEGNADYHKHRESFLDRCFFIGKNARKAVQEGVAEYIPAFLSDVPQLFRNGTVPLDVALVTVSPPDKHGYCSLGTSVVDTVAALNAAKVVIAQVNKYMPRTHGDGFVHFSQIDRFFHFDEPLHQHAPEPLEDVEKRIGEHVAALVEDGATLQMGIGAIPDAVLANLTNHKRLGVHTEMFSDGLLPLLRNGVITNDVKVVRPGKTVAGFVMGSQELYDFLDDNPAIDMRDITWVNDIMVISRNPRVTAINSAIEVDLTGQVVADSIGPRMYSGVGGQMDFMKGAAMSHAGKPIIALPSVTARGQSKIVNFIKEGAGVVTTRAHVHYVVTEFGVAYLHGKSLQQRAAALIEIAHPSHRESLHKQFYDRFRALPSKD